MYIYEIYISPHRQWGRFIRKSHSGTTKVTRAPKHIDIRILCTYMYYRRDSEGNFPKKVTSEKLVDLRPFTQNLHVCEGIISHVRIFTLINMY